jgi:hypothetical protein
LKKEYLSDKKTIEDQLLEVGAVKGPWTEKRGRITFFATQFAVFSVTMLIAGLFFGGIGLVAGPIGAGIGIIIALCCAIANAGGVTRRK